MKIDDVFFVIGLIIISSLLVFVIYDDITTIQNQISVEDLENLEENASNSLNRSDNESLVLPDIDDSTTMDLKQKTKTTSTQNYDTSKLTQKSNTESDHMSNSNTQKENPNNNVKTHTEDFKTSNYHNTHNNIVSRQAGAGNNRM